MLRTRVLTGFGLGVALVVAVFGLGTAAASIVFGLVWLIGADEWTRLAGLDGVRRVAYVAAVATVMGLVLVAGLAEGPALVTLALAALAWLVIFGFVLRYPVSIARVAVGAAGLVVLPAAWLAFHWLHGQPGDGPALVLTGIVIVWCADIGAYFAGRYFGRHALAPSVSPKKTWEGVAGGLVLATLAGVVAALALRLPLAFALLAPVLALVSVVGDLGVSMFKRHAGLKDSGVLLPGHGGILDRFDGVTAALPFFVLGLQFAHLLD